MMQSQMNEHFYAVIMAGGGGTRLWPMSRGNKPKQMLELTSTGSLFQLAISRLDGLFEPDKILVVTVSEQAAALQKQAPQIPIENYLIEPLPKGTASVVGFAAVAIQNRDPNGVMAVLTADHFIENIPNFHQCLNAAYTTAQDGFLVTLGIPPTFPATGYGYVQRGNLLTEIDGLSVFVVKEFKEKPDFDKAKEFIECGDHDWNSGMFIWGVDTILGEFTRQMPILSDQLHQIDSDWNTLEREKTIKNVWPKINPQTIDYGIMEKAEHVAVIPAPDLAWSDVGSWESLFDVLPGDENGNILIRGKQINLDTLQTVIYSENIDRLVVTIGLKDMIIVDTADALLLCNRKDAQQVRKAVQILKDRGENRYL